VLSRSELEMRELRGVTSQVVDAVNTLATVQKGSMDQQQGLAKQQLQLAEQQRQLAEDMRNGFA